MHRVAFLLDEFGQLGYMKQIEDAVSLMRGYGLAFWVFIQDLSQLKDISEVANLPGEQRQVVLWHGRLRHGQVHQRQPGQSHD